MRNILLTAALSLSIVFSGWGVLLFWRGAEPASVSLVAILLGSVTACMALWKRDRVFFKK